MTQIEELTRVLADNVRDGVEDLKAERDYLYLRCNALARELDQAERDIAAAEHAKSSLAPTDQL